jgi:hypothetical protein
MLTQTMKQGLQVTALGLTIGLAGALVVNRLIASLLFGVQPTATVTIAFVIATDYGRGGGRELAAGVAGIAARPERRAQR